LRETARIRIEFKLACGIGSQLDPERFEPRGGDGHGWKIRTTGRVIENKLIAFHTNLESIPFLRPVLSSEIVKLNRGNLKRAPNRGQRIAGIEKVQAEFADGGVKVGARVGKDDRAQTPGRVKRHQRGLAKGVATMVNYAST